MNSNTVRSIGIFAAISIVLLALVLGGVKLFKDRNAHYASQAGQNTATGQQQAPAPSQSQPPQASTPNQSTQNSQPAPAPQQQPTQTPQPAAPTPQQSAPTPAQVPVTGPAEDALVTVALMMLAAYFAFILKRARLSYRKLLS